MKYDSFTSRVRWLSAGVVALGLLLVVRLYFIQIVHGEDYAKDAFSQYVAQSSDSTQRRTIFFSDKNGTLASAAITQTGWRVAIVPKDIVNVQEAYRALSAVTPIDEARFMASSEKKDDPYEEVAFRLSDQTAQKVRAKKIKGVVLAQDSWRFYPAHELAAQTIGFVGYRKDEKVGVYGLERHWQDTLAFSNSGAYINPFAEIFTNVEALLSNDTSWQQGDIVTSIDPSVQRQLETTLQGVMKTYAPKINGGIIMDPRTGNIVAMAMQPTFDINAYNLESDPAVFSNQLVEGRYELGSIMKPLTMAAGLDSNAITATTTYFDTGCITRSEKKVCNYDGKARQKVPMQEILNQSLNLGVTFIEEKMGHDEFSKYMYAFGLGEKTGIDLPNEVSSNIHVLDKGSDVDYASASFGQSVAISPIAMTRALAVLANNGVLPTPRVVTKIKFESGLSKGVDIKQSGTILKPETVETVTNMLVQVVDTALLKGALKQEHYSIAAKTGTAQIANPKGGGYYDDRYLHSFFGYFPAHDPKFIVFLYAVEPHGAEFASATLARPFMDIAKFLINYYEIPPDR